MRKEWDADREKIQRVILNIFWIMKIVFILKDIRRDFQSEKEKMQIESEKQRNELEKKLQYGEEEKCFLILILTQIRKVFFLVLFNLLVSLTQANNNLNVKCKM